MLLTSVFILMVGVLSGIALTLQFIGVRNAKRVAELWRLRVERAKEQSRVQAECWAKRAAEKPPLHLHSNHFI